MRRTVVLAMAMMAAGSASAQDAMAPAPAKKFPTFVESDADKDGYLTQAEWDASGRGPKRFARVDADKDGKVSRAELHEATVAAKAKRDADAAAQPKP